MHAHLSSAPSLYLHGPSQGLCWVFLYQLMQSKQYPTNISTDQPDADDPSLRLYSSMILGCVNLTNHYTSLYLQFSFLYCLYAPELPVWEAYSERLK